MSSSNGEIIYIDEEIPEIEYFELVSIEELIKINPNFIAFSREEIYKELFNFVKSKSKAENFLKLFYEIITKKINVNNFIVVADSSIRGDYEEEDMALFIDQLKKYDKECIFIKKWVPELRDVPNHIIINWENKNKDNIKYPKPMVDIKSTSVLFIKRFKDFVENV